MMYGVPYIPPGPPPDLWPGVQFVWAGWDGSRWTLCGAEGAALLAGVEGLTRPKVDRWTKEAPGVAGSRYLGHRVLEREVYLPISIFHDAGSQAWLERDKAFNRTLWPDKTGVLSVTQPGDDDSPAERRSITLRCVDDGAGGWAFSPGLVGWHEYGLTFAAEDPYWRGDPITRSFSGPVQVEFFDADGDGVHISRSGSFATASIPNPGDVDAWPTYWLAGPFTAASVGVGDAIVDVPFAVADGDMLVVDTRPTSRTAKLIDAPATTSGGQPVPIEVQAAFVQAQLETAVNKTRDLGSTTRFARVPAEGNAALAVTMTGTGYVRANLTPCYYRAW